MKRGEGVLLKRWLRALVVLPEDLVSIPSTHMVALLAPGGTRHACGTCGTYTYINVYSSDEFLQVRDLGRKLLRLRRGGEDDADLDMDLLMSRARPDLPRASSVCLLLLGSGKPSNFKLSFSSKS